MPSQTTRRTFLASSLAAGAGVAMGPAALAGACLGGGGRAKRAQGTILSWRELSPGVHAMIDANSGGNVAVVVSQGESLVIDSKFPYFGQALRHDAGELGGAKVTLINTHHHADHSSGNVGFIAGPDPVQVLAHTKATPRILAQRDKFVRIAAGGPGQINRFAPDNERLNAMAREMATGAESLKASDWKPSLGLGDAGTITVGEIEIAYAHDGPGHTDNDLVLSIDSGRVIHTGDLVFNGLHPFFDPEGGVTARGWIKSLGKVLEACDADTVVVPGHGPAGDREIVRTQRGYLEQLVEKVQAEIDAGTSKQDAQEKSWDFMDGLGFESIRPRAISAVYDELTG